MDADRADADRVDAAVNGMDSDVVAAPVGGPVMGGNTDVDAGVRWWARVDAGGRGRGSGEVVSQFNLNIYPVVFNDHSVVVAHCI